MTGGLLVVWPAPLQPTEWCLLGGQRGGVELQGLRDPGLDLLDPSLFRRVSGQVLGRAVTPLCGLGHPIPEIERRVRVITCLCHEYQAEMVGLRLLGAAPG